MNAASDGGQDSHILVKAGDAFVLWRPERAVVAYGGGQLQEAAVRQMLGSADRSHVFRLIEALAYGLPCVTTRWRSIPEYFSADYPGLCIPRDVPALARALHAVVERVDGRSLRCEYEQRFAVDPHLSALAAAIRTDSLE